VPPDLPRVGIKPCKAGWQTKNTTYNWVCKTHYIHTIYDPNVHLSKVRVAFPKSNKRTTSIVFDVFSWATDTNGGERVVAGEVSLHRLHRNQLLLALNLCSRPYRFHGLPEPQEQPLLHYLLLSLRETVFGAKHRKPEL
jgi:hypothetical protein